jgi:RNA-binding motif protein, X-linked 2
LAYGCIYLTIKYDSAYVFIGNLNYSMNEGDIAIVFSEFGEIVDLRLARDKTTGKSKGFAFLAYENQKSTVLAVDNFNGVEICDRTIRVDHVRKYKPPK